MLWETFLQDCTMQTKTTVSDGQGGVTTTWADGSTFQAAIVKSSTAFERVAEKQGIKASYTVTTPTTTTLKFHDVFKRDSDNKQFIVTSDATDSQPPIPASFKFCQVTAEEFV
jgi:hypothetical protein